MATDAGQTRRRGVYRWALPALALLLSALAAAAYWITEDEAASGAVAADYFTGGDVVFRDERYFTVEMSRTAPGLELIWRDKSGENYATIKAAEDHFRALGRRLTFATNAGIYGPDLAPVGLHVENGRPMIGLDRQSEPSGNFYLLPNGVFYMPKEGGAGVVTSDAFDLPPESLRFATQSGPMLVIDGELHPRFQEGSENTYLRGGVGVCEGGKLVFAMSREPVNFYDFASLFRDHFHCSDALYLDGAITRMHAPEFGQTDLGGRFVGMLVSTKPMATAGD